MSLDTWEAILVTFGGNAALLAVLAVLGRSLLQELIDRDTKKFEADLKHQTDTAIAKVSHELKVPG